jgi:ParB family chromosome partitioning protein
MNAPADLKSAITSLAQVPLSSLDFDDQINARKGKHGPSPIFVANIRAKGVLVPLLVRPAEGDRYSVIDGAKRLSALKALAEEGAIEADHPIPVEVRAEDDAAARETSLATNIIREPMHPVDEYEGFAQMIRDGATIEDVATHYAKTRREVEQSLALGGLASEIRAAWRKGIIGREAAEAFTLFTEPREQLRVFDALRKDGHVSEDDVRKAVKGADKKLALLAEFVGVEAFAERGGEVTRDLFGKDHIVAKGFEKLLAEMKREKLGAVCEQLKADGWAWAETKESLGRSVHLLVDVQPVKSATTPAEKERLKALDAIIFDDMGSSNEAIEAAENEKTDIEEEAIRRGYSEKQKARLGCVVDIDFERNRVSIDYGKQLPAVKTAEAEATPVEIAKAAAAEQQQKQSTQAARQEKTKEPKEIDGALLRNLREHLQRAAGKALKVDPGFGLDVVIAAMAVDQYDCIVGIEVQGHLDAIGEKPEKLKSFADALARVQKLSGEQKLKWLARFAAMSLTFWNCGDAGEPIADDEDVAAVVDGLDPKLFNDAIKAEFDAKAYFDMAPKPVLVRAIAEAVSGDEAHKAAGLGDIKHIRKFCNQHIPKTGWLPIELRTAGYAGPGAVKKVVAKSSLKKKAKRK